MECIERNWLCKHMEKVRSSQTADYVVNWVKQFSPVSIVKKVKGHDCQDLFKSERNKFICVFYYKFLKYK